jgi:uncharacterized membrane protein YgcG
MENKGIYFLVVIILIAIGSYFSVYNYKSNQEYVKAEMNEILEGEELPAETVELMEKIESGMVPFQVVGFVIGVLFAWLFNFMIVKFTGTVYKAKLIFMDVLIVSTVTTFLTAIFARIAFGSTFLATLLSVLSAALFLVLASLNIEENKKKFIIIRSIIYVVFIGLGLAAQTFLQGFAV